MEFSILVHCACFLCITWRLFSVSVWYVPVFLGKIFEGHLRHTRFLAFFCSSLIKSFVSKSSNVTTSSSSGLIWKKKNPNKKIGKSQPTFSDFILSGKKICYESLTLEAKSHVCLEMFRGILNLTLWITLMSLHNKYQTKIGH